MKHSVRLLRVRNAGDFLTCVYKKDLKKQTGEAVFYHGPLWNILLECKVYDKGAGNL